MEAAEVGELAHKVRSVHKVLKVTREILAHLGQRERRATPELLELKVKKEIRANAVNRAPLVLQDKLFIAKVMRAATAMEMAMEIQVLNR